ncbi:MAG: transposase, partial [Verrucomicrobiales bacterium]|nr:transposase [Verrucomicrobiales bacterium]
FLLLADAYYANGKMLRSLVAHGSILISKVRTNAVAYEKADIPARKKRGRPKLYGTKIKLADLFSSATFTKLTCKLYGENVQVEYLCKDLVWKPFGKLIRFVLVKHPKRGHMILMSSDLSMPPAEMIKFYSLRFKIEVTFKHAIHNVGAFGYHFWMAEMTPLKQKNGNQYLHRKEQWYRDQVNRKVKAYHCFVQVGLIAQGMLQYLAMTQTQHVWNHFGSWIRTIRPGILPSESVVSKALWNTLPYFLKGSITGGIIEKFISSRIDRKRAESMRFAG